VGFSIAEAPLSGNGAGAIATLERRIIRGRQGRSRR
jgi:hypothetical protein